MPPKIESIPSDPPIAKPAVEHACEALDAEGIEQCALPAGHAGDHRSYWGKFRREDGRRVRG